MGNSGSSEEEDESEIINSQEEEEGSDEEGEDTISKEGSITVTPKEVQKASSTANLKNSRKSQPRESPSPWNANGKSISEEEREKLTRMKKKRRDILNEILETEQRYVQNLDTCVRIFLIPLREQNIVTNEEIRKIFSIIEVILNLHKAFFDQLKARVQGKELTADICIGEIFVRQADFMKMYTNFVNNYNTSMTVLSQLREENSNFETFLQNQNRTFRKDTQGWDLTDYLITPVQRLPRYRLLLEDLLRNTPETHSDYPPVKEALAKITSVTDFVNEEKRLSENIQKILKIQGSLAGKYTSLLKPHRKLIAEGTMIQHKKKKVRELHYFIFNDALLLVKVDSKSVARTTKWRIVENASLTVIDMNILPNIPEVQNRLELKVEKRTLLLSFQNQEKRDSWFNELETNKAKAVNSVSYVQEEKEKGLALLREQQQKLELEEILRNQEKLDRQFREAQEQEQARLLKEQEEATERERKQKEAEIIQERKRKDQQKQKQQKKKVKKKPKKKANASTGLLSKLKRKKKRKVCGCLG